MRGIVVNIELSRFGIFIFRILFTDGLRFKEGPPVVGGIFLAQGDLHPRRFVTEGASLRKDSALGPRNRKLPILPLMVEYFNFERALCRELNLYLLGRVILESSKVWQQHLDPLVTALEVAILSDRAEFEHLFCSSLDSPP